MADSRPRGRRRWILAILLGLVVVTLAIIGARIHSRLDGWVRDRLETALADAFDGEASIDHLEVDVLRLQVSFRGVRLDSGDTEVKGLVARIEAGKVRLAWRGLAALPAGRLHLAELELEAPRIGAGRKFIDSRIGEGGADHRLLDWRVDRLKVRHGAIRYGDAEVPLDLEADNLELVLDWSLFRRAMVGRAALDLNLDLPVFSRPYPISGSATLRLRGTRLEIVDLEATAPGLSAEGVEGHVLLEGGVPVALRGRVVGDVGVLDGWLVKELPDVEGSIQGDLSVDVLDGDARVSGTLAGADAMIGPVRLASVRGRLDYRPGEIEIRDVQASVLDGEVSGGALWTFGETPWLAADLGGRGIDLGRFLELVGVDLQVASGAALEMRFEGDPGRPSTWNGDGRLGANPFQDEAERLPARVHGEYALESGRLRIAEAVFEAAAANVEMSIDLALDEQPVRGEIVVEGRTSAARRTQVELVSLIESAGAGVPAALEHPVRGSGRLNARVSVGGAPDVDLRAELDGGSWGEWGFDRGQVDLSYRGGEIEIRSAEVFGPDGEARLTGRFDAEERTILQLDGELHGVALAPLFSLLDLPLDIEGRVEGGVSVADGGRGLEGSGEVAIRDVAVLSEPLGELDARFTVYRNVMDLHDIRLAGPGLRGRGEVLLDLSDGVLDGYLTEVRADLSRLGVLTDRGIAAEGEALISGPLRYTPEGVLGELQITGPDLSVEGFGLGMVEGDVRFHREGVDLQVGTGGDHGLSLEGRVEWTEGLPLTAVVYLDGTTVELEQDTFDASVWTRVSGHILMEGPLSEPEAMFASGELESAELQLGARTLETTGTVALRFTEGAALLGPATWIGTGTELTTEARIDLSSGTVEAAARGTVDVGNLATLWPEVRASGPLTVDLSLAGPWDRLEVRGTAELDDGRVRLLGFPDALNAVDMRLRFEGDEVVLEDARAILGGGEVTAAGSAEIAGISVDAYAFDLDVANARVRYPKNFRGAYDGSLRIRGDAGAATLSGTLSLIRGLYEEDFDFSGVFRSRSREYSTTGAVELPVKLFLDLDLKADGDLWVRNRLVDLESALDLHLGGELRRPEITGRVWLEEGGEIQHRGVEYRIQSGSLDLLEFQRINPYVEIRAETTIGEYAIFLHVQGTLDRLQYSLTSDPSLSSQDIIALMTTGRTLETLSTGTDDFQAGFTGDVVANYFASALTQPFERQLEKLLRLEQVRVDPLLLEGEADATTRLTLGKEVTDDVLVVYSTNLNETGTDIYRMQWKASRRLRLSLESGAVGGVGTDLRYTRRFWMRPPKKGEPASSVDRAQPVRPAAAVSDEIVGLVRVDGAGTDAAGLLDRLPLRSGDPFSRSEMLEGALELRKFFVGEDRIEARVIPRAVPGSEGIVDVIYEVESGPKVKVQFEGVRRRDARKLKKRLRELWIASIFLEEMYADASADVLRFHNERGFYAADVVLADEAVDDTKVVRFIVDSGKPVRVVAVNLEGVEPAGEDEVRRQMLIRSSTAFSKTDLVPSVLQEDIGAIRTLYRERGFLDVRIDRPLIRLSADGESAEVTLRIEEGPRFVLGEIRAPDGLPFTSEVLVSWSGLTSGEIFSPGGLVEAESAVRVQLDERGYPDARIGSRIAVDGQRVDVDLDVVSGDLKRVGVIEIVGTHKTRKRVIERELLLEPDDLLSRDRLLQIQHRLYSLGIFRSVRVSLEPMDDAEDPSRQRVTVHVAEGPPQRMIFGVGYDTESGFRGSFSLSHSNVRGRNRRMAIQGGASQINQRLGWIGEDPRLFGRRDLQGLLDISWTDRERVSFDERRFSVAARIAQRMNERWGQFVRYNFQSVNLDKILDSDAPINLRVEDLALGNLGYGVVRSTRDDPFSPSRGTHVSAELRVFAPVFLSEESFTRLFTRGSGVLTFENRTQFASALRVGLAWPFGDTAIVPISERFFTGGHDTLRGFERDTVGPRVCVDPLAAAPDDCLVFGEDPTGGQAMVVANVEFRYPIRGVLFGDVFYDTGNVFLRVKDIDLTDLRHNVGLGIRLETPFGAIRLEYGRKLDREPGESRGQLYLSLGNAF